MKKLDRGLDHGLDCRLDHRLCVHVWKGKDRVESVITSHESV